MSRRRSPALRVRGDAHVSEIAVLVQKDCLGGERIVELRLPRAVGLADLDAVEGVATRIVLENLPRPFFKLDAPGRYLVTGIVGDDRIRVTVRLALRDAAVPTALEVGRRMSGGDG